MCSGIILVDVDGDDDDADDDVHGSNETLCNFYFALGTLACCRAEAWCSVVPGILQRDVRSGKVR